MKSMRRFAWVAAILFFVASHGSMDAFPAQAAGTATLSGKVTVSGSAPAPQKVKMASDPVCMQQHKEDVFSREVAVKGGMLQHATVYIKEGVQGILPAPTQPVVLDQQGCMYDPPVFALQAGQPLEIRNSDPTLHNVNCQPAANRKFNIAQPTKGMKTTKVLDKPEMGIPFKCNVHPWMIAYGSVFSHPFFAVTDETGSYKIQGLPAGNYTVEVWHAKLGTQTRQAAVADGESKSVDFQLQAK